MDIVNLPMLEQHAIERDQFPPMPADFWPEEVKVVAMHKGAELGFMLYTHQEGEYIVKSIERMRMLLWQETNHIKD